MSVLNRNRFARIKKRQCGPEPPNPFFADQIRSAGNSNQYKPRFINQYQLRSNSVLLGLKYPTCHTGNEEDSGVKFKRLTLLRTPLQQNQNMRFWQRQCQNTQIIVNGNKIINAAWWSSGNIAKPSTSGIPPRKLLCLASPTRSLTFSTAAIAPRSKLLIFFAIDFFFVFFAEANTTSG